MSALRGDSERQALLRCRSLEGKEDEADTYIEKILSILALGMRLLDVGCGTGHIIRALGKRRKAALLVGLDISSAMLRLASRDSAELEGVALVRGDGLALPVGGCRFDVVINRLADCSRQEAHRVLKSGGRFVECGLGPEADREIAEYFKGRLEEESFFEPKDRDSWKNEVCTEVSEAGFRGISIEDHKAIDYYATEDDVMDLIEMVPLVREFDRGRDRDLVQDLVRNHRNDKGIGITWHYYVLEATKL